MRVRRLDSNHDWTFGQSRANYATTSEAIAQNVVTRLQSFVGDWFLDLDHGLPWFAAMEKPAALDKIEQIIKQQVLKTDGVIRLNAFSIDFNPNDRKVKVELTYTDIYGKTEEINSPL